jgi:hypothetical protein
MSWRTHVDCLRTPPAGSSRGRRPEWPTGCWWSRSGSSTGRARSQQNARRRSPQREARSRQLCTRLGHSLRSRCRCPQMRVGWMHGGVAGCGRVVLAIRDILEDGRDRLLQRVHRHPDPGRQPAAVGQRDPRVGYDPHWMWEVGHHAYEGPPSGPREDSSKARVCWNSITSGRLLEGCNFLRNFSSSQATHYAYAIPTGRDSCHDRDSR